MRVVVAVTGAETWSGMTTHPLGVAVFYERGVIRLLEVKQRSPAHLAGLKKGDKISSFDGCEKVRNTTEFRNYLRDCWDKKAPAVLDVEKETGAKGGRPRGSRKQSPAERNEAIAALKKEQRERDPQTYRECTQARVEKHRAGWTEEQWQKDREESLSRYKEAERPAKLSSYEKVKARLAAEKAKKKKDEEEQHILFMATLPGKVADSYEGHIPLGLSPWEDEKATYEAWVGRMQAAYPLRGKLTRVKQQEVEQAVKEIERREKSAALFVKYLEDIRSQYFFDVDAVTVREDGTFPEAMVGMYGIKTRPVFMPDHPAGILNVVPMYMSNGTILFEATFLRRNKEKQEVLFVLEPFDREPEDRWLDLEAQVWYQYQIWDAKKEANQSGKNVTTTKNLFLDKWEWAGRPVKVVVKEGWRSFEPGEGFPEVRRELMGLPPKDPEADYEDIVLFHDSFYDPTEDEVYEDAMGRVGHDRVLTNPATGNTLTVFVYRAPYDEDEDDDCDEPDDEEEDEDEQDENDKDDYAEVDGDEEEDEEDDEDDHESDEY